ncbi:HxlR family transcriptional regulator [Mycolicibacterium fortuitum]|uniref:HxlR family transcriptional regulator n=1 Tax=Mycolicibacterium fortuitum TaxID=1766 RepID=A0ABD6QLV9_MYCFO|nr:helix-turn-helix domain-containing protein [Mycolicibacterium fortuitum]OBA93561.1 HxlR family transcriptional regulator [Mycolicibacterium fortuitum]OBI66704.1 HxlR family transcriptional regulator [Mycolicibacterium fortuitum]OMC45445.1 HxlR family transcriptional regulator [Mycolicibacterium fortuitum]
MRADPWSDDACPIARTMSVLGQRWAILIIREALLGRSRFSEFRQRLGVASDVLSARLSELVEAGILRVVDYQEPGDRTRSRYVLTDAGHELVSVLAALGQWGHVHRPRPHSSRYRFVETATGEPVRIGFQRKDGTAVPRGEVSLTEQPGQKRPPPPL